MQPVLSGPRRPDRYPPTLKVPGTSGRPHRWGATGEFDPNQLPRASLSPGLEGVGDLPERPAFFWTPATSGYPSRWRTTHGGIIEGGGDAFSRCRKIEALMSLTGPFRRRHPPAQEAIRDKLPGGDRARRSKLTQCYRLGRASQAPPGQAIDFPASGVVANAMRLIRPTDTTCAAV
jgi:hypothetical protein